MARSRLASADAGNPIEQVDILPAEILISTPRQVVETTVSSVDLARPLVAENSGFSWHRDAIASHSEGETARVEWQGTLAPAGAQFHFNSTPLF